MTASGFADPIASLLGKIEELAREWPKLKATQHPALRRQCDTLIDEIVGAGQRARGPGS